MALKTNRSPTSRSDNPLQVFDLLATDFQSVLILTVAGRYFYRSRYRKSLIMDLALRS